MTTKKKKKPDMCELCKIVESNVIVTWPNNVEIDYCKSCNINMMLALIKHVKTWGCGKLDDFIKYNENEMQRVRRL
jgi:NMD protein affecting ribosome stability and mRNA decay